MNSPVRFELDPMNRNKKGSKSSPTKKITKSRNNQPSLTSFASAGVSSSLAQTIKFSGGARDGNLRITYRLPIAQIGNSGTTGHGGFLHTGGVYSTSLQLATDCVIDPVAQTFNYWQSVGLNLLAECFSRFAHTGNARFSYCPQSSTASTDRLVFGYSSDPVHPLIVPTSGGAAAVTTQPNLLGLRESIPFAPWNEWVMNVHIDTIQKYVYSINDSFPTNDVRLNCLGSLGCVGLSSIVSPTVYGVLYLEGSVEFEDMNPLVILTSTPAFLKNKLKTQAHNINKDDELEKELPPPTALERTAGWFGSSSSSSSPPLRK